MKISQEFRRLLNGFPAQFPVGIRAASDAVSRYGAAALRRYGRDAHHLVLCGMGGSSLAGALLSNLQRIDARISRRHLHIVVHRDYGLPPEAYNAPAVIVCVSYSGNTEETLSAYRSARKARIPVLTVASGGALAALAQRDGTPCALIPKEIPPRFSTGYQFGALIGLLCGTKFLPREFAQETNVLAAKLRVARSLTTAKNLTAAFRGKKSIPIVLSSPHLAAAAYSWGTNIQENAKLPAAVFVFPELNHNLFNAFTPLSLLHKTVLSHIGVIIMEDAKDRAAMKKRIRVTADLIKKAGVALTIYRTQPATPLLRLMQTYCDGLAFSGMLAEKLGIDPIPVPLIEDLKKRLA